jgi:hypothetical protein
MMDALNLVFLALSKRRGRSYTIFGYQESHPMLVSPVVPGHVGDAAKLIFASLWWIIGKKLVLSHLSFDQSICGMAQVIELLLAGRETSEQLE